MYFLKLLSQNVIARPSVKSVARCNEIQSLAIEWKNKIISFAFRVLLSLIPFTGCPLFSASSSPCNSVMKGFFYLYFCGWMLPVRNDFQSYFEIISQMSFFPLIHNTFLQRFSYTSLSTFSSYEFCSFQVIKFDIVFKVSESSSWKNTDLYIVLSYMLVPGFCLLQFL